MPKTTDDLRAALLNRMMALEDEPSAWGDFMYWAECCRYAPDDDSAREFAAKALKVLLPDSFWEGLEEKGDG